MRIPDISSIDLSEKYQKLYDKYVERADAPVEALESEKESNTEEKSLMQSLMKDVRAARLEYVKIKRNSIYGTLQDKDRTCLDTIVTRIKENLTKAAKSDAKFRRLLRDLEYQGVDRMLSSHSGLLSDARLDSLKQNDRFQQTLNSLFECSKSNSSRIQRKQQRLKIKLERKSRRALLDKYNFKVSLSNLESFEDSADYMLRSFGIETD